MAGLLSWKTFALYLRSTRGSLEGTFSRAFFSFLSIGFSPGMVNPVIFCMRFFFYFLAYKCVKGWLWGIAESSFHPPVWYVCVCKQLWISPNVTDVLWSFLFDIPHVSKRLNECRVLLEHRSELRMVGSGYFLRWCQKSSSSFIWNRTLLDLANG